MSILQGWTHLTYNRYHGTQVEYFAADGGCFLWYPGNDAPVPCRWKLEARDKFCFLYPPNSYNPADGSRGGRWECNDFYYYGTLSLREATRGDVFGLSSGKVPFRLESTPTTLSDLVARHRDPAGFNRNKDREYSRN